jgi:hypothetical protein
MKPFLLFTLLLLPFGQAIAQQSDAASLRERMGPEQFKAAGLDKLSADELKQLDNWITGVKTVVVEKVVEKQVEKPAEDFSDIRSSLVGEFRGWRGYTEFTLANGQIWMQAAPGELFTSKLTNPKVLLVHSGFSGWKLQVEGYNSWVKVRRIK